MSIVVDLAKETFAEWSRDKASRLAAALSYYDIFYVFSILGLGLIPLVWLMRPAVAREGAHIAAE